MPSSEPAKIEGQGNSPHDPTSNDHLEYLRTSKPPPWRPRATTLCDINVKFSQDLKLVLPSMSSKVKMTASPNEDVFSIKALRATVIAAVACRDVEPIKEARIDKYILIGKVLRRYFKDLENNDKRDKRMAHFGYASCIMEHGVEALSNSKMKEYLLGEQPPERKAVLIHLLKCYDSVGWTTMDNEVSETSMRTNVYKAWQKAIKEADKDL